MERWFGRVALVTGASEGIGLAISRKLVDHGLVVIGCARNIDKLNWVANELANNKVMGQFIPVECNLRYEAQILSLFQFIKQSFGRLDICINNAGLAKNAPLTDGKTSDWREMFEVNVMALSICSREALQIMFDNSTTDGQIVNISSMSGHRVVHHNPTHYYSGTKFMVKALTEGLRQELRDRKSKIRISSVSPGFVETEIESRLFDPETAKETYSRMKAVQATDIAQIVIDIIKLPQYVEINDILVRPTDQMT